MDSLPYGQQQALDQIGKKAALETKHYFQDDQEWKQIVLRHIEQHGEVSVFHLLDTFPQEFVRRTSRWFHLKYIREQLEEGPGPYKNLIKCLFSAANIEWPQFIDIVWAFFTEKPPIETGFKLILQNFTKMIFYNGYSFNLEINIHVLLEGVDEDHVNLFRDEMWRWSLPVPPSRDQVPMSQLSEDQQEELDECDKEADELVRRNEKRRELMRTSLYNFRSDSQSEKLTGREFLEAAANLRPLDFLSNEQRLKGTKLLVELREMGILLYGYLKVEEKKPETRMLANLSKMFFFCKEELRWYFFFILEDLLEGLSKEERIHTLGLLEPVQSLEGTPRRSVKRASEESNEGPRKVIKL